MGVYKDTSKKKNIWYVKCRYTDYAGNKKQKTKRGFEKMKQAEAWEKEFLENHKKKSADMPFYQLVDKYLEAKQKFRKQISYETSKSRITTWILPTFKDMPINTIDTESIMSWQGMLMESTTNTGKPLSPNYIHNIVVELSSIFNYAINVLKCLADNPVRDVAKAGYKAGKRTKHCEYWTDKEFKRFISTFPDHDVYYTIFMTLYWTGMRLGELLALTVADVSDNTINVNKTYHMINGQGVVTEPKTDKSKRKIDITPELASLLDEYKESLYQPKPSDRLFPVGDSTIARQLKKHSELAELAQIRIHDLRHSHASLLIHLGYNALVVSERLGHESVSTTWDYYSHIFEEQKADVIDKLSKIWFE